MDPVLTCILGIKVLSDSFYSGHRMAAPYADVEHFVYRLFVPLATYHVVCLRVRLARGELHGFVMHNICSTCNIYKLEAWKYWHVRSTYCVTLCTVNITSLVVSAHVIGYKRSCPSCMKWTLALCVSILLTWHENRQKYLDDSWCGHVIRDCPKTVLFNLLRYTTMLDVHCFEVGFVKLETKVS